MTYRIAATLPDDADADFWTDVQRDVQRERDDRRLRRLVGLLPTMDEDSKTYSLRPSAAQYGAMGTSCGWFFTGENYSIWTFLAVVVAPLTVVFIISSIAKSVAACARRRIERRHYGQIYHHYGASVALLLFTVGGIGASFLSDAYQPWGWGLMALGWVVSAICAHRRCEWITIHAPWVASSPAPQALQAV